MKLTKTQTQFDLPPFGVYVLSFQGVISTKEFENKENPDGPPDVSMYLKFAIDDEASDWHGTEIRAYYPEKVTDGNKTGKLFAAIFNGDVPEEFDTNDLLGGKFRALIKDNGKGFATLDSPTPLGGNQRAAKPRHQPTVRHEGWDQEPEGSTVYQSLGEPGF